MVRTHSTYLGLDLGQAQDFTALVVLRRLRKDHFHSEDKKAKPAYEMPFLKRFPLGTPYPEIVATVVELLKTPELTGSMLVIDHTGVGRAVSDMFKVAFAGQVACRYCPVTITGGHTVTRGHGDGSGFHVPKKELVSCLQVLMQTRRLRISPALPEAELLVQEFQNFKVKITAAANETFGEWREGQHDDMVLATAFAAWAGEQALPYEVKPSSPRVLGGTHEAERLERDYLRGYRPGN